MEPHQYLEFKFDLYMSEVRKLMDQADHNKAWELICSAEDYFSNLTNLTIREINLAQEKLIFIRREKGFLKAYLVWDKVFGDKINVPVPEGTVKQLMEDTGKSYEDCEKMFKRVGGNYAETVKRLKKDDWFHY